MATQNTTSALNEAAEAIRRMAEQIRRYESAGDATGESILMQQPRGTGLPPMINSVKQPDR